MYLIIFIYLVHPTPQLKLQLQSGMKNEHKLEKMNTYNRYSLQ